MITFKFENLHTVLCLGAHADDIEIGCGGTLWRLISGYGPLAVHWVVLSAEGPRIDEARASADFYLQEVTDRRIEIKSFRDSYFPYDGDKIKDYFHALSRAIRPDLILTHRREDLHQDHRLVSELTWNAFRDHCILEYEIPKYDADLGKPNTYVSLGEFEQIRKIEALLRFFPSQRKRDWFTDETFKATMRIRGIECNSPTGWAEGFTCRKAVI